MTDNDYTQRPANALPTGYRFEEFEIQEVIDTNNDNIVYQALDHQLERHVAIREFLPHALIVRSDNQRLVPRSKQDQSVFLAGLDAFIRDSRQLARLNHPNVLQILRFWTYNDTAYAATPLYSGMTLAELMQKHPERIDEGWLRQILPVLCSALAALHDKGLTHCRLSLSSILIQDSGLPLLLEFGAPPQRVSEDGGSEMNKLLLHPGFTPLEQYSDDADTPLGPWTDIYSLGAILYTLVGGSRPPTSVARSIQDNCVPLTESQPAGYSQPLLAAIDRALMLRPEDRPQSVAEFAQMAGLSLDTAPLAPAARPAGSMLVPVDTQALTELKPVRGWETYKTPLLTSAGVVVGLLAGGLLFGRSASIEHAKTVPDSVAPAASSTKASTADSALSRVYLHVEEGEQLAVNGKEQKMPEVTNGYISLQLSPGTYTLTLHNDKQSRSAQISVDKPGTWLLNPQS